MYCQYCGQKLEDGNLICKGCGKKVLIEENEKKKLFFDKQKGALMIPAVIIGVLAVVWGIIIFSKLSYVSVDMAELYKVDFCGLNGDGTAVVEINQDALKEASEKFLDNGDMRAVDALLSLQSLDYSISKGENLSNGEEVVFVVDFSEEYYKEFKIKAKNLEQNLKVENLIIPQEIDLFEGLEVQFSGRSPFISCNVLTGGCNDFVKQYVTFDTEEEYYKDGDTVKLIALYDEEDLIEAQGIANSNEKEYVAESNEIYLETVDGVDLTNIKQAISNQLQLEYASADELFCGVELGWTNHFTGLKNEELKGEVFLVLRDKYEYSEKCPFNSYVVFYRDLIGVEHRSAGNQSTFDTEMDIALIVNNLYVDENNELHFDDLIEVRADEVDSVSDLKSVFIKEHQEKYNAK